MKRIKQLTNKYIKKIKSAAKKKRNQRKAIYIGSAVLILGLLLAWGLTHANAQQTQRQLKSHIQQKDTELNERQYKLETLQTELQTVQAQKADTESQLKEKEAREADLKSQIDKLNRDLQTKRQNQAKLASVKKVVPKQTVRKAAPLKPVSGCGDNFYANFIYMHESGCRTDAVNSKGCRGIGQACPGSKLPCSNSDYACQNAFFTKYAMDRYGSWEAAYNFWQANRWW